MLVSVTHKPSENTQRILKTAQKTKEEVQKRHRLMLRVELMHKLDALGYLKTRITDAGEMYLEIEVADLR